MRDILDALRFVKGAVSTKTFIPEMSHFAIQDGRVRSFNGSLALSSPIDFDTDCAPKAFPLVSAIGNCKEVVSLGIEENGKLSIRSGPFQAMIDCVDSSALPHQSPKGDLVEIDGKVIMEAIRTVAPFIGNDASREWTNGVLFRDQSVFATNNVCLVEYWTGVPVPFSANVPMAAVREMIRIGSEPVSAQIDHNSITFHYPDGRWVYSLLYSTEWPELRPILDQPSNPAPIPQSFFAGLEAIKPFAEKEGRVYFTPEGMTTVSDPKDTGATYYVEGLHTEGIYNISMLQLLSGTAEKVDFTRYPNHLLFFGPRLRGAIIGQRP